MRHKAPQLAILRPLLAPRRRTSIANRAEEIARSERRGEGSRLPVQRAIEDQDFGADGGRGDGVADVFEDQAGHDGRVEGADAVDYRLGTLERREDAGVGSGPDFLPVGVDVPDPRDPRGQLGRLGFLELDVLLAERGEGAGEVGVFNAVVLEEVLDVLLGKGCG